MLFGVLLLAAVVVLIGRVMGPGLWHDVFYFHLPWQWAGQGSIARAPVALLWNAVQLFAWILLAGVLALPFS